MSRPDKKNAMNRAARRGLLEAFELARERTKVVVLTGCAGSFCSGVDLKDEPPRVCRRLQLLRGWSHGQAAKAEVFT
jgi:enoyl-CoA hydratase/carnithine racemase